MKPILLALALLFPLGANADMPLTGVGSPPGGAAAFVGLTDKETTINHCWAIAACGSTQATATKSAVNLCSATGCAGANLCTAVKVKTSGILDITTGLYCNGGTQTVTAWCAGLGAGCVVGGTGRISQFFDQVGTADSTATSYATSPDFVISGVNSKPTPYCNGTVGPAITIVAINQPSTILVTLERTGDFTSFEQFFSNAGGGGDIGGNGGAGTYLANNFGSGLALTATGITDASGPTDFAHFHRIALTQGASGSSFMYADGAQVATAATAGGNGIGTVLNYCGSSGNQAKGFVTSMATDPTQATGTVVSAVTNLTTVPLP